MPTVPRWLKELKREGISNALSPEDKQRIMEYAVSQRYPQPTKKRADKVYSWELPVIAIVSHIRNGDVRIAQVIRAIEDWMEVLENEEKDAGNTTDNRGS